MPTGFQSGQDGNVLPLSGEAEMRSASSGTDLLTMTGHSSQSTGADFLVLRTNVVEGTTGGGNYERFVVGSSGELKNYKDYVVVSATTIGGTGTTAPTLGASQSGQVIVYQNWSSGPRVLLPAPEPGLVFTVIQASGLTGHALHVSATRGASAEIRAPFRGSGLSTALVVGAPTTVAGMAAMFVAVSTLVWQLFPAINGTQGTSAVASDLSGMWTSVAA